MYLHFDRNKIHLQVICGTLEKYQPSKEVKEIQKKVSKLKEKTKKFQEETLFPELEKIEEMIKAENDKQQEEEESSS